jgi:segregation and condensation protein B
LGRVEPGVAATGEGPTARPERMARLEAVLFLVREPLGSRKLAQLAGLADGTEARTLVRKLNRMYDAEDCAFRVMEIAGGFQLMTRPKFAPWLRRGQAWQAEVRLSAPAMETLAVVAYRQPVLRVEIEAIRGVQCGEILRQLMERDLVRIVGRSEELGRPLMYGTTRRFLQVFGLRQLDDLPRPELARPGLPTTQQHEQENQPFHSIQPGGESNVRTAIQTSVIPQESLEERLALPIVETIAVQAQAKDDDEDADEFDEDEDDDEDDEDDLDEDEEDLDDEWEEVEDEDDEEDLDEDEDEDEDWDDEDEDWDDEEEDEDDDWDDEDEEEEESEEDWE